METRYAQRNCTRPFLMVCLFVLIYVGLFLKVWAVARPARFFELGRVLCGFGVFGVQGTRETTAETPQNHPISFFLLTWWITFDNNTPGTYSVPLTMYMALLRSVIGGTSITNVQKLSCRQLNATLVELYCQWHSIWQGQIRAYMTQSGLLSRVLRCWLLCSGPEWWRQLRVYKK